MCRGPIEITEFSPSWVSDTTGERLFFKPENQGIVPCSEKEFGIMSDQIQAVPLGSSVYLSNIPLGLL